VGNRGFITLRHRNAGLTQKRAQRESSHERAVERMRVTVRLVAEACGDSDLMAALGAAAVEDGGSGLGGHANEEAVNFATTAAVRLEGAFRHDDLSCIKFRRCLLVFDRVCESPIGLAPDTSGIRHWRGHSGPLDSKT